MTPEENDNSSKNFSISRKPPLKVNLSSGTLSFRNASIRIESEFLRDCDALGNRPAIIKFAKARLTEESKQGIDIDALDDSEIDKVVEALFVYDKLEQPLLEIGSSIDKYVDARRRRRVELTESIREAMTPTFDALNRISELAKLNVPNLPDPSAIILKFPILPVKFPEFSKLFTTDFSKIVSDINLQVFESLRYIHDDWYRFEKESGYTRDEAVAVLKKFGWIVTTSISTDLLIEVIRAGKIENPSSSQIDQLFISYFQNGNHSAIWEMYEFWESSNISSDRLPILKNCISIMANDLLSDINVADAILPALIAQAEGIYTEFLEKNNYKATHKADYSGKENSYKKLSIPLVPAETKEVVDTLLFDQFLKSDNRDGSSLFNRHKIMHGKSTNYGRYDYLIKALLIIDFLVFCDMLISPDTETS